MRAHPGGTIDNGCCLSKCRCEVESSSNVQLTIVIGLALVS